YALCMRRVVLFFSLAGLCPAADVRADAILARVHDRIIGELQHITNYTCVQTVSREYFRPNLALPPESCDALYASKASGSHTLHPWSLDRLRLDVAVTPNREIYSWAGAEKFDERDLPGIVGAGPISTGPFRGFLSSICGGHDAIFAFDGTTKRDGRELLQFAYRVPRERSQYRIRTIAGGWVVSAYEGAILVDPETADLLRLTIVTAELPPETGGCEGHMEMGDHRVAVGGTQETFAASTPPALVPAKGNEERDPHALPRLPRLPRRIDRPLRRCG